RSYWSSTLGQTVELAEVTKIEAPEKIGESFIQIERVTMPEFIGRTRQINGYYDVIQIDNQYDGLVEQYYWNSKAQAQRSYSQIIDDGVEFTCKATDSSECAIDESTQLLKKLTENGATPKHKVNSNYNENDITELKAKELIEFAKSGQLIYYDESINSAAPNSKLTKILHQGLDNLTQSNVKEYTSPKLNSENDLPNHNLGGEITNEKIVTDFTASAKRTSFKVAKVEVLGETVEVLEKKVKFTLENLADPEATVKIFLDGDGDSFFAEDELMISTPMSSANSVIEIEINPDFTGILPWKVEVEKNGVQSYEQGNIKIDPNKNAENQVVVKKLNVLQLTDTDKTWTDKTWAELETIKGQLATEGYELIIHTKEISSSDKGKIDLAELATENLDLYKTYDYIVLGFTTNYWGQSELVTDANMKTLIQKLVDYAQDGGGMLFGSGTMVSNTDNQFSQALTQNFRSVLGQARFDDFTRAATAVEDNRGTTDFSGDEIPYQVIPNQGTKKIFGFSYHNDNRQLGTPTGYEINTTPISDYPFEVKQEELKFQGTRFPKYQLNLEDEKIVPLYNMYDPTANDINKYDITNNYAMYKRENLSFFLGGETEPALTGANFKLFINLIISSDRLQHNPVVSNQAPVIETSVEAITLKMPIATDITFDVKATDPENDDVELIITLDDGTGFTQTIDRQASGTNNTITIPQSNFTKVGQHKVMITAKDSKGAESVKELIISITDGDTIIAGDTIRILEIQPADSFEVSTIGGWVKTGIEDVTENNVVSVNGVAVLELRNPIVNPTNRPFTIEHMTMPEFIASTKKLNGRYDVVILGNSDGSANFTVENMASDQLAYAKYSKLESQKESNDITNRRLDELKAYIASGQLFYVDNGLHTDGVPETIIDGVKGVSGTNVKTEIPGVTQILDDYNKLDSNYKAAEISKIDPATDTTDADLGKIENRNMEFVVNASDPIRTNEAVQLELTLDFNGDGLFQADEIVTTKAVTLPLTNYKFTYQMAEEFIGLIDWKIELVKKNNAEPIRSATFGQTLFRRLDEKQEIRILQVSPYGNTTDSLDYSMNLATNPVFKAIVAELQDYTFKTTVMGFSNFNKIASVEDYDIVIFGFSHNYYLPELSASSLKKTQELLNNGKGVILTHDSIAQSLSKGNPAKGNLYTLFREDAGLIDDSRTVGGLNPGFSIINPGGKVERTDYQSKRMRQFNDGLTTNYPFDLSDSDNGVEPNNLLPIRRTHSEFLQLDLEKETVVPLFTTTPNT
ncbi:MAG: DUF5057 domain-containing protein, partial [Culicoidibacterales bacterium]